MHTYIHTCFGFVLKKTCVIVYTCVRVYIFLYAYMSMCTRVCIENACIRWLRDNTQKYTHTHIHIHIYSNSERMHLSVTYVCWWVSSSLRQLAGVLKIIEGWKQLSTVFSTSLLLQNRWKAENWPSIILKTPVMLRYETRHKTRRNFAAKWVLNSLKYTSESLLSIWAAVVYIVWMHDWMLHTCGCVCLR